MGIVKRNFRWHTELNERVRSESSLTETEQTENARRWTSRTTAGCATCS